MTAIPSSKPRRPNIVLLMADQQKASSLPLYGNPDTHTPTLDALAARGVWARDFFVAHPFCFPSRCSLMTGRYAHAHGVRGNGRTLVEDEIPLSVHLQRAGYRTGVVGHFHGGRAGGERGFEFTAEMTKGRQGEAWRLHSELVKAAPRRTAHMTASVPLAADEDVDGLMTGDAITFLKSVPDDEPFFLHVAWIAPHPPYFAPPPYDAMYDPASLAYPAQEPPDAIKPAVYLQTAQDMGTLDAPEAELRQALATYYGMVSMLDDQLARLLRFLETSGRLDDTIVVYTADHGDYAGEHGMWAKSCTLYDCLVRVPFVMAGPSDLIPAGGTLEGLLQSVDLMPTLLDLIGVPIPPDVHGHSLRPLWGGDDRGARAPSPSSGREAVLPQTGRTGFDIAFAEVGAFPVEMVADRERGNNIPNGPPASGRQVELSVMARTSEWKLIYTPGRDIQELYHVASDPGELRNRYGEPALQSVVDTLRARIQDWMLTQV
ncbi:MAG TPA: sulfatase-like hydrolase/transferase [Chloroflexota bacterium]|nr:sulfatase-like hydrolase/transferase [Chloroflexota bacterium]